VPKEWTKTDAFAHFGVTLDNVQWSWSGVSADRDTVAVVLWQDGVKGRNGALVYLDNEELDAEWRDRIGNKYRIKHLRHAMDHLDGKFRAIIAKALDVNADPRKIAKCFPQEDVFWKIDSLDNITGAFTAHVLRD